MCKSNISTEPTGNTFYVRVSMDGVQWEWIYEHRNLRLATQLTGQQGELETPFHHDIFARNGGYVAQFVRFYTTDADVHNFDLFGCVAMQTG